MYWSTLKDFFPHWFLCPHWEIKKNNMCKRKRILGFSHIGKLWANNDWGWGDFVRLNCEYMVIMSIFIYFFPQFNYKYMQRDNVIWILPAEWIFFYAFNWLVRFFETLRILDQSILCRLHVKADKFPWNIMNQLLWFFSPLCFCEFVFTQTICTSRLYLINM